MARDWTGGEWKAVCGQVHDEHGNILATRHANRHVYGTGNVWPEEADANLRLMATAPEMYTACKLALASLEAAGFTNATVTICREALKKAEGGE